MDNEKTEQPPTVTDGGAPRAPLAEKIIDVVVDGAAALTKAVAKGAARRVAASAKARAGKAADSVARKAKKAPIESSRESYGEAWRLATNA